MKHAIIPVVLALSLSGCYQTVDLFDIDRAVVACEGKENIVNISSSFIGVESVYCNDGEVKNLSNFTTKGKK